MSRLSNVTGYGILAGFNFDPATAKPMLALVEALMTEHKGTLNQIDKELIATLVSYLNGCEFCYKSHRGITLALLGGSDEAMEFINEVLDKEQFATGLSVKMRNLIRLAVNVRDETLGKLLTDDFIKVTKAVGATDQDIHDVALITAAFCMYNRYVEGLKLPLPENEEWYIETGKYLADNGYTQKEVTDVK